MIGNNKGDAITKHLSGVSLPNGMFKSPLEAKIFELRN
jgi:hypothetical protein